MRMERSAVGKGKGGDFVGERGGVLGWTELRRDPSRWKDALRMTARTNNGKNRQLQMG
jgi:hypothetical protein